MFLKPINTLNEVIEVCNMMIYYVLFNMLFKILLKVCFIWFFWLDYTIWLILTTYRVKCTFKLKITQEIRTLLISSLQSELISDRSVYSDHGQWLGSRLVEGLYLCDFFKESSLESCYDSPHFGKMTISLNHETKGEKL